jgi:nitrogen fixation protein FixH
LSEIRNAHLEETSSLQLAQLAPDAGPAGARPANASEAATLEAARDLLQVPFENLLQLSPLDLARARITLGLESRAQEDEPRTEVPSLAEMSIEELSSVSTQQLAQIIAEAQQLQQQPRPDAQKDTAVPAEAARAPVNPTPDPAGEPSLGEAPADNRQQEEEEEEAEAEKPVSESSDATDAIIDQILAAVKEPAGYAPPAPLASAVAPGVASFTAGGTVAENSANGTAVGTVGAADPDGGTLTYSLSNNAGGRFAINAATGVVTVANGSLLDYEAASSHAITVVASDGTLSSSTTLNIALGNVNEAPGSASFAAGGTVAENSANGAAVGTVGAADPDGGTLTYSLSNNAGGRFAINAATGVVTVANGSLLDYEAASSHAITVVASDGTLSSSTTLNISLGNVNEAPGAASFAGGGTVAENSANGAAVGTVGATDPDGGTLTYSLSDNAGGRFAINAATGVVTVANGSLLDYEAAISHAITVVASDGTLSSSTTLNISLGNVNEAPGAASFASGGTVAENSANSTAVGTVGAADPDGGTLTYSLSNNAGGRFAINAATGVVTVANGSLLDYEAASSHAITVVASDGTLSSSTTLNIALGNVNEAPVATDDSFSGPEDSAITGAVLGNDGDPELGALTAALVTGPVYGVLSFAIDGTFSYTPVANFNGTDSFTYAITDPFGLTDSGLVTLTITAVGNIIQGTSGSEVLNGSNLKDDINALGGSDTVHAGNGNDYVDGGDGSDTLRGGNDNDWLYGGSDASSDDLEGGNGNDYLDGGVGSDILRGQNGSDILVWNDIESTADGGQGSDALLVGTVTLNIGSLLGNLASIEAIDLKQQAIATSVTLSASDVITLSDTDTLTITGTAADSLNAGTGWTDGGVSGGFHIYTKSVSGTLATLNIDIAVTVNADIV